MSTARRSFTFERSKVYTGKVQFRADGPARVSTDKGDWTRGEVKAVKSERYANALVEGGMHAHVAADAPVGIAPDAKAEREQAHADVFAAKAEELTGIVGLTPAQFDGLVQLAGGTSDHRALVDAALSGKALTDEELTWLRNLPERANFGAQTAALETVAPLADFGGKE